jgi:hypothetical protein
VYTEIVTMGRHLSDLLKSEMLGEYVARRREEVFSEARSRFVKEGAL